MEILRVVFLKCLNRLPTQGMSMGCGGPSRAIRTRLGSGAGVLAGLEARPTQITTSGS